MADKKISDLGLKAELLDTDALVVVDSQDPENLVTKRTTYGNLKSGLTDQSLKTTDEVAFATVSGRDLEVDGTKLDGIEEGATADQTAEEIKTAYESNLDTNAFTDAQVTKLAGIDTGAQVNTVTSVAARTGDVVLTKVDVGLSNVDNTSDLNKPVSTATQTALNLKTNITDIMDNLTSTLANVPLSANQGRALKGLIDTINGVLQSDDGTLDELQEIVNYIKLNRETLDTLSISSIAGLQDALDGKAPTVHTHAIGDVTGLQTALDDKVQLLGDGRVVIDSSGRLSTTYEWTGSALQTTSIEIIDANVNDETVCPTLFMHNYGDGGVKIRMGNTGDSNLYFSSAQGSDAGSPVDDNSGLYFSGILVNGKRVTTTTEAVTGDSVARFDGTTGAIRNSSVTVGDGGTIVTPVAGGVINAFGGYTPVIGSALTFFAGHAAPAATVTDLNDLIHAGAYNGKDLINSPLPGWVWVQHLRHCNITEDQWALQVVTTMGAENTGNLMYMRSKIAGDWTPWQQIYHTGMADISRAGAQTVGTQDATNFNIKTNNADRVTVDSAGDVQMSGAPKAFFAADVAQISLNGSMNIWNGKRINLGNINNTNGAFIRGGQTTGLGDIEFGTGGGLQVTITNAGYTKLGSNAPAIKTIKVIGTTGVGSGITLTAFADIGVPYDKVVSYQVQVESKQYPDHWLTETSWQIGFSDHDFATYIDPNRIAMNVTGTQSQGQPFKLFLTYEE